MNPEHQDKDPQRHIKQLEAELRMCHQQRREQQQRVEVIARLGLHNGLVQSFWRCGEGDSVRQSVRHTRNQEPRV